MQTKQCKGLCGQEKPLEEFWVHHTNKDGRQTRCKECLAAHRAKWWKDNPERAAAGKKRRYAKRKHKIREARLKKLYNLAEGEYDLLLSQQCGGCAVTGLSEDAIGRRLHVDHCHISGRVRGLLCDQINKAAGLLMDSPELCRLLAIYLETHGQNQEI